MEDEINAKISGAAPATRNVTAFLLASQDAMDVTINSAYGENFSIFVKNEADEDFSISGVLAQYEGIDLGKINSPQGGALWLVPAKNGLVISWPTNLSIMNKLVSLKGQFRGQFSVNVDFVFHCLVDDEHKTFRKRISGQVDALNRHMIGYI